VSKNIHRFTSSIWLEKLVPVLLTILVLALLITLIIIGLAWVGAIPGA
jgi:hypothetical protein